jgi:hypothetical protein
MHSNEGSFQSVFEVEHSTIRMNNEEITAYYFLLPVILI